MQGDRQEGMVNATRLALAGGFDGRPPFRIPLNARIIRFPLERRRRGQDDLPPDANVSSDGSPAESRPPA